MADITFTVSAGFLTRVRAAIVAENPALTGQTTTQLNEAGRQRFKRLIIEWLTTVERQQAIITAKNSITPPAPTDIT